MASLPLELILQILTMSMRSEQPHPQCSIELKRFDEFGPHLGAILEDVRENVEDLKNLAKTFRGEQLQPQHDWLIANSVCRAWKEIGPRTFFQEKVFLVGPNLMKALVDDDDYLRTPGCKDLTMKNLRNVIVPLRKHNIRPSLDQWMRLPAFNHLTELVSCRLLPNVGTEEKLEYISLNNTFDVSLPRRLQEVLVNIGFDLARLKPRFLVSRCRSLTQRKLMELFAQTELNQIASMTGEMKRHSRRTEEPTIDDWNIALDEYETYLEECPGGPNFNTD
ncbi:uncharacterized protein KY384_003467 [Bacidia gigantensis]|uniref:uncharacterized protein n=1 Tax=Bacidia gigantensis TaxID=2732470 RepID=UPI001D03D3EA|nr:uncharacterized protein KY384_003467 [Bacidia gigantensis]KAG8531831.1 hypothetical protein KY384_003467 [Bacidia gigantensis]